MIFKDYCNTEIKKKLIEDLKLKNPMEAPRMLKVVINVGAGEAVSSKGVIEKIQEQITIISGQKTVVTLAKQSISAFKIRKGLEIGVKVTLRGDRMYAFVEKLVKVVIPRLRDFKGIAEKSVDQNGNLNIGFTEQTIFPEIEFDKIDKTRGLEVTVVTNAKNHEKGKKLFELLGVVFKK
ncbi:MAG: 50S ribosomal protein L5 [bacterium]|nr:50S ribosomal protein L5 [bacterium]